MLHLKTKGLINLILILALAFYLRVQGMNYGLPYGFYPDEIFSQSGSFLIFLRCFSILFSIGSIILIYFIGSIFSQGAGLLASAFLAVSFLHVIYSKLSHPACILTFFLLFLSLLLVKAEIKNKYKTIFHVLVFIVLLPSFINPFINHFVSQPNSYFLNLFSVLISAAGPLIWISFFLLPWLIQGKKKKEMKIIFSVPIFIFGILGLLSLNEISYSVLLVPYFALAGGIVFSIIFSKFNGFVDRQKLVFIILFLLAVWMPLKNTLNYNKLIKLSDTRAIATEWILRKTSNQYVIAWDENSLLLGKRKPSERKRYIIDDKFLSKKAWFRTLRKKADYVVVNSYDVEKVMRSSGNKLKKKFYRKILNLTPEITFNPYYKDVESKMNKLLMEDLYLPFKTLWQRERFGPLIRVYKI